MRVSRHIPGLAAALARVAAFMAALTFIAACAVVDPPVPPRSLSLSGDKTVEFDAAATSVSIVATLDWTLAVTLGADWITPDSYAGAAGQTKTVNFTLGVNDTGRQRTGKVTITAEGEENDPYVFTITQQQQNVLSGVNKWIREELEGWYYWNAAVKSSLPPSGDLAYDDFLERSILQLWGPSVQDTSHGENPPTIDGRWARDRDRNMIYPPRLGSIYSYIERTSAATRAGEEITQETFGFDVEAFEIENGGGRYELLITWVLPKGSDNEPSSPATDAGLTRGMWIDKIEGADIYESNYRRFWNRLHLYDGGTTLDFSIDGRPYLLTAKNVRVSPIIHHSVIESEKGTKVAYLMYNEFPGSEFDNELRNVFKGFNTAGATELVLDLRYNPGGYVPSCRLLSSLVSGAGPLKVFVKMLRNPTIKSVARKVNPEVQNFLDETNSIKLNKVYILATRKTASASEMVINALRGVDVQVVHIGERTEGKNVGMDLRQTTIEGYTYKMWPITFKGLNAKDFTDYADGFVPDYAINEFSDAARAEGTLFQLGDRRERLLQAALTLIDGGTLTPDSRATRAALATRAAETERIQAPALEHPARGGAKYIPEQSR